MPKEAVKTVLKSAWDDLKQSDAFLKKVFAHAPRGADEIEAEQLAKKLDRPGLANLLIDAIVRLQESMEVMRGTVIQIDLCKDELAMSQKKIVDLQSKVINSQDESIAKLSESAEVLVGVSEEVKSDVNKLVEEKKSYADMLNANSKGNPQKVDKLMVKQAWAESQKEDERLRSVIVSGLWGPRDTPQELRREVNRILEESNCDYLHKHVVSMVPVGKEYIANLCWNEAATVKLLRVTFSSRQAARTAIRESKRLKDSTDYNTVYVNPDRTPDERQKFKALVKEMKSKIAEDPSLYWRIYNMKVVSSPRKQS